MYTFFTFVDLKLLYPQEADTTALTHPNFSTGNNQGIVSVCIDDLSGSGFRG